MESLENLDPIDDQITNNDDSVTNKDGDNMLEQEEGANVQNKPDEVSVPTVTPDAVDVDAPEDVVEDDKSQDEEASSNKGDGPKGENL